MKSKNHSHEEHGCCDHHNCDHEHSHDDHENCNHDHSGIESHMHEESTVVSGKREITGDIEIISEKLQTELKKLASWVEENGGIVGHIKAYLDGGGRGYMLSTTGDEVHCKEMQSSLVHVVVTAIVFNVTIHEMECKVADIFTRITVLG